MTFRWLLNLAAWLDRRFPPKVVVTEAVFEGLQEKEHRHAKDLAARAAEIRAVQERLEFVEKGLAAIKDAIAKGDLTVGPERDRMRSAFIKGEHPLWDKDAKVVAAAMESR